MAEGAAAVPDGSKNRIENAASAFPLHGPQHPDTVSVLELMWKIMKLVIVAVLASLLLTACASTPPPDNPDSKSSVSCDSYAGRMICR